MHDGHIHMYRSARCDGSPHRPLVRWLSALAIVAVGLTSWAAPSGNGQAMVRPASPGGADLMRIRARPLPHRPAVAIAAARPRRPVVHLAMPLAFEPNRGQANPRARFVAHGSGYALDLNAQGAVLTLGSRAADPSGAPSHGRQRHLRYPRPRTTSPRPAVVRLTLVVVGGNPTAAPRGDDKLRGKVGYYLGTNRRAWRMGIPTYARVYYAGVYRGVDLVYYGNQRRLEYDFRVAPGADPRPIRVAFRGVDKLTLAANGDVILRTVAGVLRQRRPVVYQVVHGARRRIGAGYMLSGHTVGFRLGAYDTHAALVIDPVLVYSTYYGGAGADRGNAIAVDGQGNAYVVGTSTSVYPAQTAFVSKFDPTGTQVLWTQYFSNYDPSKPNSTTCNAQGNGVAVDGLGNTYVTGSYGYLDEFGLCTEQSVLWAKIDLSGNILGANGYGQYSDNYGQAIALDGQGNSYITGQTSQGANNFPVTNGAFQTTPGIDKVPSGGVSGDAFVLKLDPSGAVVYGTFLGGSGIDNGLGIAVDGSGDAIVAGSTSGTANGLSDFPVTNNALQAQPGNLWAPGFVSELSPDGSSLLYSTFLSGNNGETVNGVAVDGQGYIYVVGATNSADFPVTPTAFKTTCGTDGLCNATKTWYCDPSTGTCYWRIQATEDVFLAKLNPRQAGAASLVYSTFLGGMNRDLGQAIAVDQHGSAYITGRTASLGDFPTRLAFHPAIGGDWDAFVAKIDTTMSGDASLIYSTYLGGSGYDEGDGIAVDGSGNAYVTGYTASTDFPTQNPAQAANNGGASDAFVAKLSAQTAIGPSALTLNPSSVNGGQSSTGTVTLNVPAPAGGAAVTLASGNPAATVPASVVVPAGATSAAFTVSTQAVGAPTAATISGAYGGVSKMATLTVNPAVPTKTSTSTATNTPTNTPTSTPVPPTATATNAATKTPVPPTATTTNTPVPPTATKTPVPATATATKTPVPATATATHTPVGGASIVRSPNAGAYQRTITVTGTNFGAAETVKLYWDSTATSALTSTTTTGAGAFVALFSAPQTPFGAHTILALGQSSGRSASAPFTAKAKNLLLTPFLAQGSQDVVKGTNFAAHETVKTYWNSTGAGGLLLGTSTTNSLGTFTAGQAVTFTTPLSPTGSYPIISVGQSSGGSYSTAVTLHPTLTIAPSSGAHGTAATLAGTGYGAGESVAFKWNCSNPSCTSTLVLGTVLADSHGNFSGKGVTIPAAAVGSYSIDGKGATSGAFANTTFNVTS